jgi:hypothetical protein
VSHSISVRTSKEKITVANHFYVSGKLLSHSSCTGGEMVHLYFLAAISRCVSEWHAFEAQTKCCCVSHSFSMRTSKEKLTVSNLFYFSGQPLSHSSCTGGELVHLYRLAAISRCVSERHAFEAQTKCCCVSHSFSVRTSKEKLIVANHFYVSRQPLSHSSCTGGELVHLNFRCGGGEARPIGEYDEHCVFLAD